MRKVTIRHAALFVAVCALVAPSSALAGDPASPGVLKGHVSFLASDTLEGRSTPSIGLDVAAEYIAAQYRRIGLEPVGDEGYFQTAPWEERHREAGDLRIVLGAGPGAVEMTENQLSVIAANDGVELDRAAIERLNFEDPVFEDEEGAWADRVIVSRVPSMSSVPREERRAFFGKWQAFGRAVQRSGARVVLSADPDAPLSEGVAGPVPRRTMGLPGAALLGVHGAGAQRLLDAADEQVSVTLAPPRERSRERIPAHGPRAPELLFYLPREIVMSARNVRGAACLVALLILAAHAQAQRRGRPPAVPGSYIVKFAGNAPRDDVDLWTDQRRADPLAPTLVDDLYRVDLSPTDFASFSAGTAGGISRLVEYIHPDYYLFPHSGTPPDTDFDKQWPLEAGTGMLTGSSGSCTPLAVADIEALKAWLVFDGPGDSVVAVVDSGINPLRHEFDGTLWTKAGEIGFDTFTGLGVKYDSDLKGHGTSVAAIIGAGKGTTHSEDVVGVYPGCTIMPVRAFQVMEVEGVEITATTTATIIKALGFVHKFGARVVNNSYGAELIYDAQGLRDVIDGLRLQDVLFVCSAGNGNLDLDVDPFYPAAFDLDNIVVVTSTTHDDQLGGNRNWGRLTVDLGAPGEDVYTTKGQFFGYGWVSGTSYATAHVTGAATLLRDFKPEWTYDQVKACLLASVRLLPSLTGKVVSDGVLNLRQAMKLAAGS